MDSNGVVGLVGGSNARYIEIWIRCGDRREEEEEDVGESARRSRMRKQKQAEGFDGRGDSVAALELRSGVEDQC
ncbi:hypothetical protein CFP56_035552 [Quercus suber]|uniref:Uncharacterized protein n=1 Tax=Quercus suber TaxID=58331 RepID=A0AAW0LSZ9_QUESU